MNGGQMDDGADYVFGEHRRRVKLLTQQKGDGATKEGGEAVGSLEHEPSLYPIQVRKKVSYGCDGEELNLY